MVIIREDQMLIKV